MHLAAPSKSFAAELRRVWNETPAGLRFYTKISLILAFLLFGVGIAADICNWFWANWGYFINIVSAFNSFLVGLPLALIGLNAINERRERAADIRKANHLAHNTWKRFSEAVEKACTDAWIDKPAELVEDVRKARVQVTEAVTVYAEEAVGSPEDAAPLQQVRRVLTDSAALIESKLAELDNAMGKMGILTYRWSEVKISWDTLNTIVRRNCLELDLPWLESLHEARMHHYLRGDLSPFMKAYTAKTQGIYAVDKLPRQLREVANQQGDKLVRGFLKIAEADSIIHLIQGAREAGSHLKGLRATVREVETSSFVTSAQQGVG